ncbi:MAG: FAD-dependent oxidoreductase, partial [Vicinamibacterales bacterium]
MMDVPRADEIDMSSGDGADRALIGHVHPPHWKNPAGADNYNLVVLGGGTAGLVCAMGAAGLGARVALVERHLLGGDCLNTGCVPSKAIIRSARAVGEIANAGTLGITAGTSSVEFAAVMRRMRERRAAIAEHDGAARLTRAGVDVFFGEGRFADARTIVVGSQRLRFSRAVIATGGRPTAPPIPGLDQVAFFTNETIFALTTLP